MHFHLRQRPQTSGSEGSACFCSLPCNIRVTLLTSARFAVVGSTVPVADQDIAAGHQRSFLSPLRDCRRVTTSAPLIFRHLSEGLRWLKYLPQFRSSQRPPLRCSTAPKTTTRTHRLGSHRHSHPASPPCLAHTSTMHRQALRATEAPHRRPSRRTRFRRRRS